MGVGNNNVFLGYAAGYNETGSDKLYIANSDANIPLIYGEFDTGKIGIGTNSPLQKLHIAGSGMTSLFVHETNNNVIGQLQSDSSSVSIQSIYNHPLRFSINDIERIAYQDRQNEPLFDKSKCAVVAKEDLTYGLSRMWEAMSAGTRLTTEVFRDINDAVHWLSMDFKFLDSIEELIQKVVNSEDAASS